MCQEQDSGGQGEGRKEVGGAAAVYRIGRMFISMEPGPFPSPWGNKLHDLTSQVNKPQPHRAHTATKITFSLRFNYPPSPLIGPNFLPGRVLRLNSTRVGQRSEVENHQLDLLRGGVKSRTRRSFFYFFLSKWRALGARLVRLMEN